MTDNFKEIGSLFGREGAGAGFAKQTDKESFTYAFAWPEGDTWATLTGYLNLDEQPEEYVRRVLQDGGFRSDWGNPDYDPIGDFKETAGDEYRIPLLKVLPSRDRCLRHPAHRGHQAGRHGKLRGARSGDEYGFERLQQAELYPLLRPVTGYGCLRVRKRQENRSARRPIRASACGKLLRSRY